MSDGLMFRKGVIAVLFLMLLTRRIQTSDSPTLTNPENA